MNQVTEQIAKVNRAGVDRFETLANTAFAALEQITALNLGTARSLLNRRQEESRNLLGVATPPALLFLQAESVFESSRQAMDYSWRALEISSRTQDCLSRLWPSGASARSKSAA